MNSTFERLQTALHRWKHMTGTVSHVMQLESGPVLGVYYEGTCIVIPADDLKLPERLVGTDINFIVLAIDPDANIAVGCAASPRGEAIPFSRGVHDQPAPSVHKEV